MNELARSLPDPTPPRGARERVRAGVLRRLTNRRRRRAIAYAGALVAAGIAVVIAGVVRGEQPREVLVELPAPSQGAPLVSGVLELPSRARVLVGDGAVVSLVRDDDTGTTLRIHRGSLVANVAPRAPGKLFVVLARDVRVEVVGTLFAVVVGPEGAVGVRGVEGVVRVRHRDGDARVGPGDTWPTPELAPPVDDTTRARVAFTDLVDDTARIATSTQVPATTPPTANGSRRPTRSAIAPSAYAAARRLEDAGKLDEALVAYRSIASGSEAEDALYAIARVLGASGNAEAADEAFHTYREQYADGRYARAVDVRILDRALARRDFDAVLRETDRFLAAHPSDAFAPRFLHARAAVRILRGDCEGALADLDRVPRTADVEQLRGACRRRGR